jgi:dipeptidyl aminopeptidase/acylaminoacyl peptidase
MIHSMKIRTVFCLFFVYLLPACQSISTPPILISTPTPVIPPALTTTPVLPTATPTVAQLIYPYTIDGLRHHTYKSGNITIVSTLAKTDAYTGYLINYPSDGLTISGVLQVPTEGHPPFPVIIMDHGYFNREEYSSGNGTDRAAEYLNMHGYLTVSSDYRSWGKSDIGPSIYYSGLAIDVLNLISAIPSIPQADSTRIGIWGHSMGGGVTLKVLEVTSTIKAAVLYSTVSADDADVLGRWGLGCIGDILAGEHQLGCNSSDVIPLDLPPELIKAYYDSSTDADLLHQTSSFYHLDLITAPIEINYGTNDGKILAGTPPDWSKKLYQAFKDAGKDAHLFAYDGELHSFNGDSWIAFMERSSHFFDQYVKNTP